MQTDPELINGEYLHEDARDSGDEPDSSSSSSEGPPGFAGPLRGAGPGTQVTRLSSVCTASQQAQHPSTGEQPGCHCKQQPHVETVICVPVTVRDGAGRKSELLHFPTSSDAAIVSMRVWKSGRNCCHHLRLSTGMLIKLLCVAAARLVFPLDLWTCVELAVDNSVHS